MISIRVGCLGGRKGRKKIPERLPKSGESLPQQQQQLEQCIADTDDTINKKGYALYGLTEGKVKMVELPVPSPAVVIF